MHPDPDLVIILSSIVIGLIGYPIARAIARRISGESRGSSPLVPGDLLDRMDRLENIAEATQIEVERISEGQRFTTRLLTDRAFSDSRTVEKTGT